MGLLTAENISFIRDGNKILDNINIEVNQGDFITISGGSGSGKSTFLKMCGDLISPDSGSLSFNGKKYNLWDPYELRKKITYVFQTPSFFFDSVSENLFYPFEIRKEEPDRERTEEILEKVNLGREIMNQHILNLSGGEKQRIALVRSLIYPPEILLLDEVTSALDAENTLIVEKLIEEIYKNGTTILWVTHNAEQKDKFTGRKIVFEKGTAFEEVKK